MVNISASCPQPTCHMSEWCPDRQVPGGELASQIQRMGATTDWLTRWLSAFWCHSQPLLPGRCTTSFTCFYIAEIVSILGSALQWKLLKVTTCSNWWGEPVFFSLTLFRCLVFLMCCNPNELKVFTVHVTEIQGKCTIQNLVLVELWLRWTPMLKSLEPIFAKQIPVSATGRYLRSKRVAHRDLKPENLLLTSEGCLKLVDFDAAMYVPEARAIECQTDASWCLQPGRVIVSSPSLAAFDRGKLMLLLASLKMQAGWCGNPVISMASKCHPSTGQGRRS